MKIWAKLSSQIAKTRTSTLSIVCFFVGFGCILPLSFSRDGYGGVGQDILISLMFFFWGLGGLPMIIRQDADFGLFRIEGLLAVLIGVVLMTISFALVLLPLW